MDLESPSFFQDGEVSDVAVSPSDQSGAQCSMCRRLFSPDNEVNDQETFNICGECKLMSAEDPETTMRDSYRRRLFRRRRARHSSSESFNDLFSHQFSNLISRVRQSQYSTPLSASERDFQLVDGDAAARTLQHINSCTRPSGSRVWWRSQSDSEGEGLDNMDSAFGESESNVSLGVYGASHWESDSVSFSAYGAESDVSVDGHSYVGREVFNLLDDGRYASSDTDIDPMRAGLDQWNFSDEGGGDWEGANSDENLVEDIEGQHWLQSALDRSPSESNGSSYWLRRLQPPGNEGSTHGRIQERRSFIPDIIADLEESSTGPYIRNSSDYFDARRFELFEEHTDSSRTGAPPAAVSFRDSLPRVLIREEQEKHGGLVCAICKDPLLIGTEVNQLPCMHFYHPCCIFTWLRARNSCPLCRFELPTDDKDYEERKQNSRARVEIHDVQQDDTSGDSADNISNPEADEACEFNNGRSEEGVNGDCATGSSSRGRTRGSWFFIAATPIVSLIALVIWLRNPRLVGRGSRGHRQFCEQGEHQLSLPAWGSSRHILGTNRNRRWWSIY